MRIRASDGQNDSGGIFLNGLKVMERRGEVRHPARFAQQVEHRGWCDVLPRNISPSDIDVVFDNMMRARTLFGNQIDASYQETFDYSQ